MALNVCGLNSKFKYGILEQYVTQFNIICLSETKTTKVAQDEFPDYSVVTMEHKSS